MAKKKKKKEYKVSFESWFLMLNEGYYDIDYGDEELTLEEFLSILKKYFS